MGGIETTLLCYREETEVEKYSDLARCQRKDGNPGLPDGMYSIRLFSSDSANVPSVPGLPLIQIPGFSLSHHET